MKNYTLVLFFFISSLLTLSSQGTKDSRTLSINFENLNRIEILKKIEKNSNYNFYFIENWFKKDELLSGDYKNEVIAKILDDIFRSTIINYYFYSNRKIILTSNSYITDSFPGLDKKEEIVDTKTSQSTPIFYDKDVEKNVTESEIIRIGKETKNSGKRNYILTGYVKDITTKEPISNLAIIVKNKNAVTNEKGYYSIKLPAGFNSIEARSLGYTNFKKKVVMYNDGTYNFFMNGSSELLDELVIETNRDKNIKDVTTGVVSIKVRQIKTIPLILGERDILKVATTIPGIKTAGEGSLGFNVRGGKEDQNLILLDDAVLYNSSHFFGVFSAINPFTTGNVDIYKGSIPAEFGGRLSSVFNIKTKEANFKEFKGEVSLGPVTSNINLETPIIKDTASLIVGGRGTYSNWILRSIDNPSLNRSSASFYDFNLKYTHKANKKNKLVASTYYSYDAFSISSDSVQSYNNRLISLKWSHRFSDKNFGDLIITNSQYKFNIEFVKNSINDFDLAYKVNETELKLRMEHIAKKHKINYGFSTKLFNLSPGEVRPKGSLSIINPLRIADEKALESGIFISDNFEITKKLALNLGLRYSFYAALGKSTQNIYAPNLSRSESSIIETRNYGNNEVIKTYGGPEARASFRYSLTPSLSVKGSFNNTYQFIHNLSNNTTATPTDTWRLSNLNIKPQQANQYSLGFYKNIDGNNYELSIEGYYKNSKNILDYRVGADLLLNQQIENEILQGKGKAYGIEFLVKKNKGRLNGWIGYSYSRSFIKLNSIFNEDVVNNGLYFPANFDKPHDLSVILNWKLTKRYSFSSNFSYQTGRPITYPVGTYIFNNIERVLYSERNKFRVPNYYRLDIGVNIEGTHRLNKVGHSFWNFSIYNVLGRNNPFSIFFVTEEGKIKAYKNSIFAIAVPTITYNIKF